MLPPCLRRATVAACWGDATLTTGSPVTTADVEVLTLIGDGRGWVQPKPAVLLVLLQPLWMEGLRVDPADAWVWQ